MLKNTRELRNQYADWQVAVIGGTIKWVMGGCCIERQELRREQKVSKRNTENELDR